MIHFDLINFGLIQSTLLSWWRQGQIHSTLLFWCSPDPVITTRKSQARDENVVGIFEPGLVAPCWHLFQLHLQADQASIQLIAPRQLTRTTRRRWRYTCHSKVGMLFSWHRRGFRVQGLVGISYNRRSAILYILWLVYLVGISYKLVYPTNPNLVGISYNRRSAYCLFQRIVGTLYGQWRRTHPRVWLEYCCKVEDKVRIPVSMVVIFYGGEHKPAQLVCVAPACFRLQQPPDPRSSL